MYDNRGSVWRKWDLHIHTPASFHWEGGKRFADMSPQEEEAEIEKIIVAFEKSEVDVFGIMDYWTFDGYLKIKKHLERRKAALNTMIFPGIELRIEAAVDFRLNIHAILSDKLTVQQLSDFKHALKVKNIDRSLSDEALIQFAKELDISKAQKHGIDNSYKIDNKVALELGSKTAEITRESFRDAFKTIPEDCGFVILPYDTSDGLMELRWDEQPGDDIFYMQLADIFETRDYRNIDLFNGKVTKNNISFIKNFQQTMGSKSKPAISGSDAHKISDYGNYPSNKITWIKADTEFEGLKQILIEPAYRTYIGAQPPKRVLVENNRTKYISGLFVDKCQNKKEKDIWFENIDKIPINHDLVAIIGNKGSGKSAFTDITALVGKTKNFKKFSFLSSKKFRNPKSNKAKYFEATIEWEDKNKHGPANLGTNPENYENELLKYLPQNFIEELCNSVTTDENMLFENEIKNVIFSWVPESERFGKSSLNEIIDFRSDVVNKKVEELKRKINLTNKHIITLEERLTVDYKKEVNDKLKEKKNELESHKKNKPSAVEKPNDQIEESDNMLEVHTSLTGIKKRIEELESRKDEYQRLIGRLNNRIAASSRIIDRIKMIDEYADDVKIELTKELDLLGIEFDRIFKIEINLHKIKKDRTRIIRIKEDVDSYTNGIGEKSITNQLTELNEERKDLENTLNEPNRQYQEYLRKLQYWEKKKKNILGSEHSVGSLEYLKKQIHNIDVVYSSQLKDLKEKREKYVKKIHNEYMELKSVYSTLYEPVSKFIRQHVELLDDFDLSFDVSIEPKDFKKKFLKKIHLGIVGSFQGESDANKYLSEIHDPVNFNDVEQLLKFSNLIYRDLNRHRITNEVLDVEKQLKGNESKLSLYNFLFGLEYLEPTYQLKLDEKELYQLSPGERGTLLLLFYLLIDRDDRPLIIDQPEENLDNETVYKVLVPCIREAKNRRQVIMVTHNPNLAVVCDAEQIIVANIDKRNGNEVYYETGSIENPSINQRIIDILEGTRPAFDIRDAKYGA